MKYFLIKLVLFLSLVFSCFNSVEAVIQDWIPPEDYVEDDSTEMGIESKEEDLGMASQIEELNIENIFGEEQVFPFPPGLGN